MCFYVKKKKKKKKKGKLPSLKIPTFPEKEFPKVPIFPIMQTIRYHETLNIIPNITNIRFKWVCHQTNLELSSFPQEWLCLLQDKKYVYEYAIRRVECPFPTGGGSGKSLPLKTITVNSEQADLAYLLRVIKPFSLWWWL